MYKRSCKKAIVEKLSAVYHRRSFLPETGAKYPLEVALNKDKVLLTLDTTGSSLFKRGYRVGKGGAPLKENMAKQRACFTSTLVSRKALCRSSMWFRDFADRSEAMIGHNIAPGFNRDFVCETWDWMPAGLSEELRAKAEQAANYDIELDICGYDIDGKMIEIAKKMQWRLDYRIVLSSNN